MNPFKFILAALRSAGVFGLYMDSGGGSSAPASQTQVSDLPDWAKPYAKETLGKAQALTDINQNPYQTYGGEKVAGFSPMQQQSFQGAAGMQPSQLGAQAGQMAGAATMGALGTQYDPYQMGQFTAGRAAQYMNPFVEMAMEPQLREAQRASEIQRTADMGQATRAGAFGGSRQAIIEAERQRNLGTQMGDIRARGLMSAFEQAQQNFAREQQLREQSRQYGAGLGLQGLQTALTGAGQMGALGGQQFQQGMDINKLQNLYGTQQQQLEQQRLSQQYQDFMNQQRYPYQQLEFMSNILRGTPMGTVQTLYGGQPNLAGQIAGLGLGAYGLSKMFAEGGEVDSYAEGGVTSDANVEDILSKLSDQQLMQAKQVALAQRDVERAQMIDAELAERASLRGGLGGAFNMLPQEQQDAVTEMAGGGIVAFSNGGDIDPLALIGGNPLESRSVNPLDLGRIARGGKSIEEYYSEPPPPTPGIPRMAAAQPAAQTYTRRMGALAPSERPSERPVDVVKGPAKTKPVNDVTAAANAVANAAAQTTGVKRTEMKAAFNEGLSLLKDTQGEADSRRMVELINRISKSEAPDKMDMLANAGFRMAKAASEGKTLLSAAVEGAQVIPEMRAQAKKEAREAQRLGATLEMEKLKLDAANRKGDRAAALQHAQNIRIMEGQEAQLGLTGQQLAETKRANIARERLQGRQIDVAARRAASGGSGLQRAYMTGLSRAQDRAAKLAQQNWGTITTQQDLKKQGFTTFDQYYNHVLKNELKRAVPISGVTPDDED